MRISVDYDRCEGHGLCAERAPDVFSLDDDAELRYHFEGAEVPGEHASAARAAVNSCPVAVLRAIP
ncbi:ferredoxin [Nocardiopsis lambiniae]|uniref:Ferredoxin n=1 Tax=Nocardiopsis lambiniae TaxID=3075539 RepID=A0ABU2M8H1_9ACTN|nr:ferredoxin [Nocardiopsis sp. DSM 44743]MDT0328541.1 ferredoxin [Nocardiopsis sp. DSM 44743]